jgi:hypothetical protein
LIAARIDAVGTLDDIDPATGAVTLRGTTRLEDQDLAGGLMLPGGMTSLPDGTLTTVVGFADAGALDIRLVATAP